MVILHVIASVQNAAGTSVFCCELSNGLVATGHDVTIAVCDTTQVDVYPLSPSVNLVSIYSLFATSGQLAQTNCYDIIHIHALWSPALHKVSKWAKKNNIPVVWSPHGMLTPWAMENKKWKKRLGWWLYQKRDLASAVLLHATAESEVEDLRRMGLSNKIVVAPLGVKLPQCARNRKGAEKVLLFVSRIQRKKGLINLAHAWAKLKQENSSGATWLNDWKVRIVGPDQEGHTEEIRTECARLRILSDWEFVGPKYGLELQQEYDNADLFVLPTYSENFGSVIIEALAHAIPVITTKGTPWQELEGYIDAKLQKKDAKQRCGWWIDIGVEPLVAALKEAVALTGKERRLMGMHGRQLVEEKYTWDAVVKTMEMGYEEVLNART